MSNGKIKVTAEITESTGTPGVYFLKIIGNGSPYTIEHGFSSEYEAEDYMWSHVKPWGELVEYSTPSTI